MTLWDFCDRHPLAIVLIAGFTLVTVESCVHVIARAIAARGGK